ncbi:MAG: hypothetical protein JWN70_7228 [Planctomycetaceae bacterium]|nr:hypothetical protein [Planctomycetaceae bacterium]
MYRRIGILRVRVIGSGQLIMDNEMHCESAVENVMCQNRDAGKLFVINSQLSIIN